MKSRLLHYAALLIALVGFGCDGNNATTPEAVPLPGRTIPFQRGFTDHLYIDVTLCDSITGQMVFDTGNTFLMVDSTFYAHSILPRRAGHRRMVMMSGAGGAMEMGIADVAPLPYTVDTLNRLSELSIIYPLNKIVGDGVDGMVGMELIAGKRLAFDYIHNTITLLDPQYQPDKEWIRLESRWIDDSKERLTIPLSITVGEVHIQGDVLLDTGNPEGVILSNAIAEKFNLQEALGSPLRYTMEVGGIGGGAGGYLGVADSITIGGFHIPDNTIEYSTNKSGALADNRYIGIIGNDLLKRFDLIIDFSSGECWIRKNAQFGTTAPKTTYGVGLTNRQNSLGGFVVNSRFDVAPASIEINDLVTAINGTPAKDITPEIFRRALDGVHDVRLEITRGGKTFEVVCPTVKIE